MVFPGSLKERNLLASSPPHTVRHPRPSTPSALGLCWRAARADRHAGSRGDSLRLSPDRVQVCRLGCVLGSPFLLRQSEKAPFSSEAGHQPDIKDIPLF